MKQIVLPLLVLSILLMNSCDTFTTTPEARTRDVQPPIEHQTYDLNIEISPPGAGSVFPPSGQFVPGLTFTIEATPASGYVFDHWGGDVSGLSNTISITMDSDKNVIAFFKTGQIVAPAPAPTPAPEPEPKPKPKPEPKLSASCRVKDWSQNYWEFLDEWDIAVEIYIEIENTGDLDIGYWEVFYIVECSGGKDYYGWCNGVDLKVGEKDIEWTMEIVDGNKVLDVEIDEWELDY